MININKNKVTRFLSIVLSFSILSGLFTGCSNGNKDSNRDRSRREKEETTEFEETTESTKATTTVSLPTNTPTPTPTPMPDVIFDNISSYEFIEPFSTDGYAWISYYSDSNQDIITQLVDRNGYVYYEISGEYLGNNTPSFCSKVQDGVSWIRLMPGNVDWMENSTEYIINTNGTVLYKTRHEDSDKGSLREHILGYGNGKFLVLRYSNDINGEKYTLGTIDKNGKVVDEFWEAYRVEYLDSDPIAEYLQDDYFYLGDYIYNVATQECIFTYGHNCEHHFVNTYNGVYYGKDNIFDFINTTEFSEDANYYDWRELYNNGVLRPTFIYLERDNSYPQDVGGPHRMISDLYYCNHGYYDGKGTRVMTIEQYANLGMWCSSFNEGYAIMVLLGGDGYYYITVIDSNGEEQFDPFRIVYRDYTNASTYSAYKTDLCNISPYVLNGKFVCQTSEGLCLYDVKGNLKKVLYSFNVDINSYHTTDTLCVFTFEEDYVIAARKGGSFLSSRQYFFY